MELGWRVFVSKFDDTNIPLSLPIYINDETSASPFWMTCQSAYLTSSYAEGLASKKFTLFTFLNGIIKQAINYQVEKLAKKWGVLIFLCIE